MNQFILQPMSTAPIPKDDEYFQLLVLEQYTKHVYISRYRIF